MNNVKFLAKSAIFAALYVAITWLLAPISYGPIQFRVSEILILICVYNPKYIPAMILGCFLANTTSSLGWYDMVFGTIATAIAVIPLIWIRKFYIAPLFAIISNGFIVSVELGIAFDMFQPGTFFFNVLTIALGEAVVLYLLGIPLMIALGKNEKIIELLELDTSVRIENNIFTAKMVLAIFLTVLGIILFIAYPIYQVSTINDEGNKELINKSMLDVLLNKEFYVILMMILPTVCLIESIIKNKIIKIIINIIASLSMIIIILITGINNKDCFKYVYYYFYFLYPLFFICYLIYDLNKKDINIEENKIEYNE